MIRLIMVLVLLCLLMGCISASSSTGAEAKQELKASQGTNQETSAKDMSKVKMDKTIIEDLDKDGKITRRTIIGGGSAETGSQTNQQSTMEQQITAINKAIVEANSKSSLNLTLLAVIGVLVLIFSVIWRVAPILIKKFIKPL